MQIPKLEGYSVSYSSWKKRRVVLDNTASDQQAVETRGITVLWKPEVSRCCGNPRYHGAMETRGIVVLWRPEVSPCYGDPKRETESGNPYHGCIVSIMVRVFGYSTRPENSNLAIVKLGPWYYTVQAGTILCDNTIIRRVGPRTTSSGVWSPS